MVEARHYEILRGCSAVTEYDALKFWIILRLEDDQWSTEWVLFQWEPSTNCHKTGLSKNVNCSKRKCLVATTVVKSSDA